LSIAVWGCAKKKGGGNRAPWVTGARTASIVSTANLFGKERGGEKKRRGGEINSHGKFSVSPRVGCGKRGITEGKGKEEKGRTGSVRFVPLCHLFSGGEGGGSSTAANALPQGKKNAREKSMTTFFLTPFASGTAVERKGRGKEGGETTPSGRGLISFSSSPARRKKGKVQEKERGGRAATRPSFSLHLASVQRIQRGRKKEGRKREGGKGSCRAAFLSRPLKGFLRTPRTDHKGRRSIGERSQVSRFGPAFVYLLAPGFDREKGGRKTHKKGKKGGRGPGRH